eukprot:1161182-Pelagomonas_calceolata.AAC.16
MQPCTHTYKNVKIQEEKAAAEEAARKAEEEEVRQYRRTLRFKVRIFAMEAANSVTLWTLRQQSCTIQRYGFVKKHLGCEIGKVMRKLCLLIRPKARHASYWAASGMCSGCHGMLRLRSGVTSGISLHTRPNVSPHQHAPPVPPPQKN